MANDPYSYLVPDDGATDLNPSDTSIDPQPQETPMNGKSIVKSKTFWINLATAVAGVLATLGGSDLVQENPQMAGVFTTVIGVVNVLLRLVTSEKVTISK